MTTKQAFTFGFLYRCAEEGLDPGETQARIDDGLEKQALVGQVLGGAANVARNGLALPFIVGIGGGGIAGALAGHTLGKMHEDRQTPEDVRRQEIIAAYNSAADKAERNAKLKSVKSQLPIRSMGGGMRVV